MLRYGLSKNAFKDAFRLIVFWTWYSHDFCSSILFNVPMDKKRLLEILKSQVLAHIESALSEAKSSKAASTHEESKAENKYDTRGLEASYIAEAQSLRAKQLEEDLYNISKIKLDKSDFISVGSLVELKNLTTGETKIFFILPLSGYTLEHKKKTIKVISTLSPLGKVLLNKSIASEIPFKNTKYLVTNLL